MSPFDRRLTPARPDLAARALEGRVAAARFADGEICEVIDAQVPLRHAPAPDAALDTEVLRGERVTVYERDDEGFAWGQLEADGYVGYLPANALAAPGPAATHTVAALRTHLYPGPSIKVPPVDALPFGARLAITGMREAFAVTAQGLFLPAAHVLPLDARAPDFVAVAERFVGAPYLWGGKTSLGIDCSALVQVSLAAAGVPCPRDSDMQEAALGRALDCRAGMPPLQRGDLIFWRGHVGIMRDPDTLLHANAFGMAVTIEPLAGALARIAATGSDVTSVRRL